MTAAATATRAQVLEREAHDSIRAIRLALDDLAATLEALRQIRQATDADRGLVVEHGPCGRPEVTR